MPCRSAHKAKKRGRRNPGQDQLEAAAGMSEAFHGRPAREVRIQEEAEYDHAVYTDLGRLRELRVRVQGRLFRLPFHGANVRVVCTPDGKNIYFARGDQSLDLASLNLQDAGDKDLVPIGECTHIVYHTQKAFHNFEDTDYVHEFGEEGGTRPHLSYSTLNRRFLLEGGSYTVKPEGIVN